jgi:hypothetical protein
MKLATSRVSSREQPQFDASLSIGAIHSMNVTCASIRVNFWQDQNQAENMRNFLLMSSALASISVALPASAQVSGNEAASRYDAVIVTARKRERNLIGVPLLVTVATKEPLTHDQVYAITALSPVTPALEISQTYCGEVNGDARLRELGTFGSFRSDLLRNGQNGDPRFQCPRHEILNRGFDNRDANDQWKASFFVLNLTKEREPTAYLPSDFAGNPDGGLRTWPAAGLTAREFGHSLNSIFMSNMMHPAARL